ncbi:unnamed protein product [Hymenolepis diminuta]|uniref:MMS1_N domain-containing protein n=1 Tax=Hymenolepis diminuta TaxID=6216 RepID=A0A0R3SYZ0_HYMDI|nr:unnamed protein product [Hymenolepis diminuta]
MTPHPMLDGKSPTELLLRRRVRTISHAMIPRDKTNHKTGVFTVGDIVFVRDSRKGHSGRLDLWSNPVERVGGGRDLDDMEQDDYLYLMASNPIAVMVFLDGLMLVLDMYSMQSGIGEGDTHMVWLPVGNIRIQILNSFTYLELQINAIEILTSNITRAKKTGKASIHFKISSYQ